MGKFNPLKSDNFLYLLVETGQQGAIRRYLADMARSTSIEEYIKGHPFP